MSSFTKHSSIFERQVTSRCMGIIIRQSIKKSVVSIVALVIAAVAQLFIYTLDSSETYGAAQRILAISMLVYPILLFGVPQALVRFYGKYKER